MRRCDCGCGYEDVSQNFVVYEGLNFCRPCAKKLLHFLLSKILVEEDAR